MRKTNSTEGQELQWSGWRRPEKCHNPSCCHTDGGTVDSSPHAFIHLLLVCHYGHMLSQKTTTGSTSIPLAAITISLSLPLCVFQHCNSLFWFTLTTLINAIFLPSQAAVKKVKKKTLTKIICTLLRHIATSQTYIFKETDVSVRVIISGCVNS